MEKEKLKEIIFAAIALAALNEQGDREHREEQKNPAEAKQKRERAILPIPCQFCGSKDVFAKKNRCNRGRDVLHEIIASHGKW